MFKKYFTDYKSLGDTYKKLLEIEGERNEDQVYAIKKVFNKMKKKIERVPENKKLRLKETKKIIDIVDNILYFNESRQGLKTLTPNQMLSRLPISVAQLKAGNNSEKLKNEIRQLLYSLCRSKRLIKQLYKSLTGII